MSTRSRSLARALTGRRCVRTAVSILVLSQVLLQAEARRITLTLLPSDVLPTGNEWISLPEIRASDGALMNFNALSMRNRGLLQVSGQNGSPALLPYFAVDGKPISLGALSWDVIEYWIPTGSRCE